MSNFYDGSHYDCDLQESSLIEAHFGGVSVGKKRGGGGIGLKV
jgi:hypothetical protein